MSGGHWYRSWWARGWDSYSQDSSARTWEAAASSDANSVRHNWTDSEGNVHNWEHPNSTWRQPELPITSVGRNSEPSGSVVASIAQNQLSEDNHAERNSIDTDVSIEEITEPKSKKPRLAITDYEIQSVNKSGNSVNDDVKWVKQEDPMMLGPPASQALWLIVEKSYSYQAGSYQTWLRPATQLSDLLEEQYQADIGYQAVTLLYTQHNGSLVEHMYEHDLRGEEWLQNRVMLAEDQTKVIKWSKKITRVIVG